MHQMENKGLSKAGYYLAYCPICGRSFAIRFEPYDRQIFVEGDNYVAHSFTLGEMTIGEVSVEQPQPKGLEPFERWADGQNFDF